MSDGNNVASHDAVPDDRALVKIVEEYLTFVIEGFGALSGQNLSMSGLARKTLGNINAYLPPHGRLILAHDAADTLIGCVFLKRIRPDAGEMKRLYVRPAAQGQGLGRRLVQAVLDHARAMGMTRVFLDTGLHLKASHALYLEMGFRDTAPYPESENPAEMAPYLRYMQKAGTA